MASAADIAASLESITGGNDEEATVKTFLDTGFAPLNYALANRWDGGFPMGRMVEVAGPGAAGKTAIATRVMASAQKMGGIAGFADHEHSYSLALAPRLELDLAPSKFVYKKPRTFEESLGLCVRVAEHVRKKELIPPEAPIAWVFDSLASMVPNSVLLDMKTKKDRDLADGRNMNDTAALARATSAQFPAFSLYLEELGICGIFLNQIRMKVGVVYGDPRKTPGGEAPYFYDSQKVMLSTPTKITKGKGEDAEVLGVEITALVAKNKITRPFRKAKWRFMFQPDGYGRFDVERSTIDFLLQQGMIEAGRPGYAVWEGKQIHPETLARQIEKEGRMAELLALLPREYEPEEGKPDEVDTEA